MTDQEYDFFAGWHAAESDGGEQVNTIEASCSESVSEWADGYLTCLEWHKTKRQLTACGHVAKRPAQTSSILANI